MFKLHMISELKEAFINATDNQAAFVKPVKIPSVRPASHKKIMLYDKRCIGCGACATVCPAFAITPEKASSNNCIEPDSQNFDKNSFFSLLLDSFIGFE